MKSCTYCAEQIQDAAIKCRHCGMSLEARPAVSLQSFVEDYRLGIALAGSMLLGLGVFVPIASLPIVGSVNYFQNGKGDGALILALAVASTAFAVKRRYGALWWTGGGSIAVVIFAFVYLSIRLNKAKADLSESMSGSMFEGLAEAAAQSVQLQWGWFVLFIGALLVLTSAWGWKASKPFSVHRTRTLANDRQSNLPADNRGVDRSAHQSVGGTASTTAIEPVWLEPVVSAAQPATSYVTTHLPPASQRQEIPPPTALDVAVAAPSKFGTCSNCERLVLTDSVVCRFCNSTGPDWTIRP